MVLKKKKKNNKSLYKDSRWSMFLRYIGVVPRCDFLNYADDVLKVLHAFEEFTLRSDRFCNEVASRLGIRFEDGELVEDKEEMNNEAFDEYEKRGMI